MGGVAALAAIAAIVLFLVVRRRRRSAAGRMDQWHTMPGEEKVCTAGTEHATERGAECWTVFSMHEAVTLSRSAPINTGPELT